MKTYLAMAAAAACIMTVASADANAWSGKRTYYGPNGGQWTVERQEHCSNGTCTYKRSVTGPWGNTRTNEGAVTDTGNGWERRGTITRRDGSSVTYGGSGRCSGGTCEYSGGRSGSGGTSTWSGEFNRY